ncbi:MAG TPA: pilus assembly protein N-terminal domain-containing protein, partial [Rariglobus sp.]
MNADVQRFAVGDGDTLSAEAINSRELLLLGKSSGRTSLLIWLRDGTVQEFIVTVHRDLSMLESALHGIHPSIRAEIAPDRDAVILTGLVPDVTYARGAERLAQDYMGATRAGRVLVLDSAAPQPPATPPTTPATPPTAPAPPDSIRVPTTAAPPGTVINMIRVESLPPLAGDKIQSAIADIGGRQVKVRRVMKGDVLNDQQDVFILEGNVPNQVALTRILTVAAQILTGQTITEQDIRVVADEAGALTVLGAATNGGAGASGGGGGGTGGAGGLTGRTSRNLTNQVRRNVARAKILEAAGGRILSLIEVADIPQVRVAIRLMELNRAKLKAYAPNLAATLGSRHVGNFNPPNLGGGRLVGPAAAIENVLSFLGGGLALQTQATAGKFALDAVLSLLEQQSIARTLSAPSLTVLSGEQADFQVGGTVPVPESFSPALGGTGAAGVFSSVTFLEFGVSLNIRPLVGDDDTVTLDLAPTVTAPDTTLTTALRQTTGTN